MRPSGALDFTGLSVNVLADQCNALMCALLFFWTFTEQLYWFFKKNIEPSSTLFIHVIYVFFSNSKSFVTPAVMPPRWFSSSLTATLTVETLGLWRRLWENAALRSSLWASGRVTSGSYTTWPLSPKTSTATWCTTSPSLRPWLVELCTKVRSDRERFQISSDY